MPFGMNNAPAVFHRLMEQVLMSLNPENRASVCLLIYSETLQDHLKHHQLVLQCFDKASLKLKPSSTTLHVELYIIWGIQSHLKILNQTH